MIGSTKYCVSKAWVRIINYINYSTKHYWSNIIFFIFVRINNSTVISQISELFVWPEKLCRLYWQENIICLHNNNNKNERSILFVFYAQPALTSRWQYISQNLLAYARIKKRNIYVIVAIAKWNEL